MQCIKDGCTKDAEGFSNYCKDHQRGIISDPKPTGPSIKRD
jgi:hypothetical protein